MSKRSQRRNRASTAKRAVDAGVMPRAEAMAPGADTSRRAASQTDQVIAAWRPPLRDANSAQAYERGTSVARVRDLIENNQYASAAVDRAVGMQVGLGLRYSARHELMAQLLNIPVEAASILATQIESAWRSWSEDPLCRCDWEGEQSFGEMLNLAARQKVGAEGEAFAVLRWEDDPAKLPYGWRWRTSLQMLDPDRVSNPIGRRNGPQVDGATLTNGVETDGRHVVAYHVRDAHPGDPNAWGRGYKHVRVLKRSTTGRPVMIHLRSKTRPGEKRGVSKFVALLRCFKQLQNYTDAELANAALNAMFAAAITTTKPSGEAAETLGLQDLLNLAELRSAVYQGNEPKLSNGVRLPVLAPGDSLDFNTASRAASNFQMFVLTTLQGIAAGLGLSASQLTMDFSKTNFSSWRGEMLEVWRGVLQERRLIAQQFATPVLLAVVEEAIDNGDIVIPAGCPGLYENTAGWLAGRWIGPSRGTIDPSGEVDSATKRVAGGFSTMEDEALDLTGNDYEAIAGQVAYERELWAGKGLTPTALKELGGATAPGGTPAPAPPAAPVIDENTGAGNQPGPLPEPEPAAAPL